MPEQTPMITFQTYSHDEDAMELVQLLDKNGILYQIVDASPHEFVDFGGNEVRKEWRVKIRQADFDRARSLLEQQAAALAEQLPEDYYLHDFSDAELIEILREPDAWSADDYVFAQHVLAGRGRPVDPADLQSWRQKRADEMLKQDEAESGLVILGYSLAILGGLLGVVIGWYFWKHKKTNLKGEQQLAYDELSRQKGKAMFWLGIVAFIVYSALYGIYWWGDIFILFLFR